jgi:KDO2-lipid IV(A) lauroyltransferase
VGTTVHYEGLAHLQEAYARGRGVLLFSGHFGQWELTALLQGYLELPLVLITRPLDNPALERRLAVLRQRSGNRVIHKRSAVREMVKALRQGIGVAIVIDQDAGPDGVFVPFFGRMASTTPTLARIALRTGAAVIPTFSIPEPDGTYRAIYGPEVVIEKSGDSRIDTLRLTAACTATLETWVRRRPEHWLWMHRRWKTEAPEGTAASVARDLAVATPAGRPTGSIPG